MLILNFGTYSRYLQSDPGITPTLCNSEAEREVDGVLVLKYL